VKRKLGDDGGCFEAALEAVRTHGGVLEHPEGSHAFRRFNLPIPAWRGGWTAEDANGGRSCCVAQGNYGHRARKLTWLYAVSFRCDLPELDWTIPAPCADRLDQGFHSAAERAAAVSRPRNPRLSTRENLVTPELFARVLIRIAQGAS
jgi:hypothetical protein